MDTYTYAPDGNVMLTGARYSDTASTLIRETFVRDTATPWHTLSAYDVSLVHAFYEAGSADDPEYDYFLSRLTPSMRTRARALGMIL